MRPSDLLIRLEPDVQGEVLEVLTATRSVRAERIRAYWADPNRRQLADVLMDLEIDDDARNEAVLALRPPSCTSTTSWCPPLRLGER
mgnify:CR=1 FL=1